LYLQEVGERPTWENYRGAGMNLVRIGDFERALPLLRKAVQLAPDSAQARYALALGLVNWAEKDLIARVDSPKLKDLLREAIGEARQATELQPDHAQSYFMWGLSLYYLGEFEASIAPLNKGVAVNPGDFSLQLHLADSLFKTGKTKEAETHFENAHRLEPDNPLPIESLKQLREKKISPKD
jgi:tetratricopeptide (TPR) repeat protein